MEKMQSSKSMVAIRGKTLLPGSLGCPVGQSYPTRCGELYARYRLEKSFFGYNPAILKSGIQKYARRAELSRGLWCLIEMDSFSLLERDGPALSSYLSRYPQETRENTKTSAKRIRTNMVNRLIVMMSEEVNISAWWMPLKIRELYQGWIENRGNPSSWKYLVDMYRYLNSQKMIRLISDLHSVYLLPPDYVKPRHIRELERIHQSIQKRYPQVYVDQDRVGSVKWEFNAAGCSQEIQHYINGIIYNLEIGSDHIFYWIKQLCDLEKADRISKFGYLKLVWKILHNFLDQHERYEFVRETVSALQYFYKKMTHREKPIYLYHAVLLLVRRDEIDWRSRPPQIDTSMTDIEKLYSEHINDGKVDIDDYVLDLHTKSGRRSADDLEKFALEGAYVENENDKFLCKEYREIYILLKKELDRYFSGGRKVR